MDPNNKEKSTIVNTINNKHWMDAVAGATRRAFIDKGKIYMQGQNNEVFEVEDIGAYGLVRLIYPKDGVKVKKQT